jgi:hypothetical protein
MWIMQLDEIGLVRKDLMTERQKRIHARVRGQAKEDFREKYLSIRDRESLLEYEELKILNRTSSEPKIFDRPRKKKEKPNRRLRIWVNLLMIAMVLAVVFFSVITPRLTPTHGDGVEDIGQALPNRESLP